MARGRSQSQEERWRLFVALELPSAVRDALVAWRDRVLAGGDVALRPVGRAELHVTLCFLGSCPGGAVEAIGAACSVVGGRGRPALRVGEAVWLPRRRPGVLAVVVDDVEGRLAEVQGALARALVSIGTYELEARPFVPHITIARVRRGAKVPRRLLELESPEAFFGRLLRNDEADVQRTAHPLRFEGERVTLYRSVPGRGGSRYESLHVVEL